VGLKGNGLNLPNLLATKGTRVHEGESSERKPSCFQVVLLWRMEGETIRMLRYGPASQS
jgi:hypothetical protein